MNSQQHIIPATQPGNRKTANARINIICFILAFGIMLARAFLYTGHMPLIHLACLAGKTALIPIAFILALRTPGKPTSIDLGLLTYGIAMYVCCLINHTQIMTLTLLSLDVFIYWALCRWFFVRQSLFPLKAATWILLAFIAVNFLLVLWKPDGIWRYETNGKMYYLLGGNYNNMGKAMVIAIVSNILLLVMLPRNRQLVATYLSTLIAIIVLSIITLAFLGSMTSLLGILILICFGSLLLIPARILRIGNIVLFIAIYFAIQSWAVFRDTDAVSTHAEYFVENVLKKDMTFSMRTLVWDNAKGLIEQRPVIGYGENDDEWYNNELTGLTTHNLVLHILLKGGWIAMSAFLLLLLITHIRVLRNPSPELRYILLFGLWTFLFMMIFEVYPITSLAFFFIYAAYLKPQTA